MPIAFAFGDLTELAGGRSVVDVPCPLCGPERRDPKNRSRAVLRLWSQPGFVSYACARCGTSGFTREDDGKPIDHAAIRRIRIEMAARDQDAIKTQHAKALGLLKRRQPIRGTVAETYLREARGITCALPMTLGFLPARGDYAPAMIAAFALAIEPEPGLISISPDAVRAVHVTRLTCHGAKATDGEAKIMIGRGSAGSPIVLAPMNDLLGLCITEGIEDALSGHQATGLGAWAAGSAARLPALADVVPDYCDCVSVVVDDDPDGRRHATALVERLTARGIHVEAI